MKVTKLILAIMLAFGSTIFATAQNAIITDETNVPQLKKNGNITQLIVDGKPTLMIAGELHNSSSSTPEYFSEALNNADALNINTVIVSIAWEQFEPAEGQFDYKYLDFILKEAYARDLKIVLIWFATWKNGESSYTPLWVKQDTKKFFRAIDKNGEKMTAISPLCEEARMADAKAFTELMRYIQKKDTQKAIVMIQVENEPGLFSSMDYCDMAKEEFNSQVPEQLVKYLKKNRDVLEKELKIAWESKGAKEKGTWSDLFGDQKFDAQNFFLSWHFAFYINEIARQGKTVYNLPMYVNSWLVQYPGELPGKYPNGGPVSRVMDIYRAAAPDIDFLSPDIYLPNFKEICNMYHRPIKNNPLFIPECERSNPGKAWYALAEHNALGFAPFGVESMISDLSYGKSFEVLKELLSIIQQYQGSGKMRCVLKEGEEQGQELEIGGYKIKIEYDNDGKKCYGIIIQTGDEGFLVAGIGIKVTFSAIDIKNPTFIGRVLEGAFENGTWKTYRQLNGDETYHNTVLFVKGRSFMVTIKDGKTVTIPYMAPIAVLNQSLERNLQVGQVQSPGIYSIKLYHYRR